MKTLLSLLGFVLLSSSVVNAATLSYKFTFSQGDYIEGTLEADIVKGQYFLQNVIPGTAAFYNKNGVVLAGMDFGTWRDEDGWYGWYDDRIPANGGTNGIDLEFNKDGNGHDWSLYLNSFGARGYYPEETDNGPVDHVLANSDLTSWYLSVPDAPATLSLLSLGLLGIAGVKRASSRRL